jgi:hypothetical protein
MKQYSVSLLFSDNDYKGVLNYFTLLLLLVLKSKPKVSHVRQMLCHWATFPDTEFCFNGWTTQIVLFSEHTIFHKSMKIWLQFQQISSIFSKRKAVQI